MLHEGKEILEILVGYFCIGGVGHCRIEALVMRRDTETHRASEIRKAITADASIAVGRYVGRINRPEGRRERHAAGEGLAARRCVTSRAVADNGKIGAIRNVWLSSREPI